MISDHTSRIFSAVVSALYTTYRTLKYKGLGSRSSCGSRGALAGYRPNPRLGSPCWARTSDNLINSQVLLPTELKGNIKGKERRFTHIKALLGERIEETYKENAYWRLLRGSNP